MPDDTTVPTPRQFSLLTAAMNRRLRRFYYTNMYVDAVTSGWTGMGGGRADTQFLRHMADLLGWLEAPPETSPNFDGYWELTEAGRAARGRYLAKGRGN